MHCKSILALTTSALVLLEGCTTLPSFSGPPVLSAISQEVAKSAPVPTVDDVVRHIQCEIWMLPKPPPYGQPSPYQEQFADLWKYQYVVYAILTIDVTDSGQVNTVFDFIHLLSAASTNRTLSVSPQFGSAGHRNITLSFVLDLDPKGNPTFFPGQNADGHVRTLDEYCAEGIKSGAGIKGDLGIREIVAEGLRYTKSTDFLFPTAASADVNGSGISTVIPNFGTTIDFTITYGLGGGPNWTLVHFTGPTSGSGQLLNYIRTHKDTLQLTFAAVQQRDISAPENSSQRRARLNQGAAAAAANAKEAATLTLLQHIVPLTH